MATRPGFIPIGETGEFLDSVQVNTPAGDDLHRETVVVADPEDPAGLAKVINTVPAPDAYGGVVRVAGAVDVVTETTKVVIPAAQSLELDFVGGAYQTGDAQLTAEVVYLGNLSLPLPTGAAAAAKQLPDNHLVQVSNFPATQAVSGVVTANQGASPYAVTQSGTWTVAVNNFPATQAVSGTVELGGSTLAALESVSVQNTVTVQSTDLDIRNLSSAQDSVNVGNFPATQSVSGTVTANLGTLNGAATAAKQLPDNHNVTVSNFPSSPSSGTNSSVAGSTSQVTLLAANASRKGATIYNDSTLNALKISLGATVAGTSFTAVIASTGYYEVPFGYTGIITGVFNTATGAARITEVV